MEDQIELFPSIELPRSRLTIKEARSGTFTDNMKLPIHRWFRYSAGFSAEWVESIITQLLQEKTASNLIILDPFSGSGTTLLAAEHIGIQSYGFESHPFVVRIANSKLLWSKVNTDDLRNKVSLLIDKAKKEDMLISDAAPLLIKCYSESTLKKLFALKKIFLKENKDSHIDQILWLAITSILRSCSHAGTAQWQYVLPNKKKSKVSDPFDALLTKTEQIISDIEYAKQKYSPLARNFQLDARLASKIPDRSIDFVITSPPYPNNYDYADATRLEMTFWDEIEGWSDLHEKVRKHIIRSCSQHSAADRINLDEYLNSDLLNSISDDIKKVCNDLAEIRKTKGGKKAYHTMIAAYFLDMAKIFIRLRSLCKDGAKLCFVIGDSAPYGIYVPTENWLGKLAISAGFKSFYFEKIRDRNTKWKNRKHSVPLHEGRLWIEG